MPALSDDQLQQLSKHVELLDEVRRLRERRVQLDLELEAAEEATLSTLQGVGAVVLPVDGGEWHLRADRDENGPFVDTRYEDEQWSAA